jgi:hypothetical protein
MRLNTLSVLTFISTVAAMPPAWGNSNGMDNKGNTDVRFSVPDDMTVHQAQAKCGDQAQLSCCNKATYAKDTTDAEKDLLAGALSNLIAGGSGSEGLGLFEQCSQLDLQRMSLNFYTEHIKLIYFSSTSAPWYSDSGPDQEEVPAEHCLLPELSFRWGRYTFSSRKAQWLIIF